MGERALEAARERAMSMVERGESPDLVAILREEFVLEPRAVYERAVEAIAETAASNMGHGSNDREAAIERWAKEVRGSGSLYLALGDAISWFRQNPSESAGETPTSLF